MMVAWGGIGTGLACALRLTHDTDTIGTTGFALLEQMWLFTEQKSRCLGGNMSVPPRSETSSSTHGRRGLQTGVSREVFTLM